MHVVQINFFVDPQRRAPETLLREWFTLVDIAAAVVSANERVTVVQASTLPGRIEHAGATFHFVPPDPGSAELTRSEKFRALLHELRPDVIHVHGFCFPHEVKKLRALAPCTPILLQEHADRVPRLWRRGAWRRGAAAADGMSFGAQAHTEPFERALLLPPDVEIFEIPELTSSFTCGDVATARAATGLGGEPAVLCVGSLIPRKDPLTVLEGISAAARALPNLKLWWCYAASPLLPAVQARIERDEALRGRVHLLGRAAHEKIEELMRAADLFVLGSHREGGSSALIEAMATGLTPVVTDIPSSRMLTGNGAVGALWPCGDWQALGAALLRTAATSGPESRSRVRAHFDAHLSPLALGRNLVAAYTRLLERRAPAATRTAAS